MAKKRGMSVAQQQQLEAQVDRLKVAGLAARKRASANKDEGKQAIAAMAGGALAGWLDAQQEMLLDAGEKNSYELIADIPTEGLIGAGLVVYGIAKKKTIEMAKEAA